MKADVFEKRLTNNVRDFARQIWLAGLGAFARTQEQGGKFFETLVQEGQAVDVRMKKVAEEKTDQMKGELEAAQDKAGEIRDKATGAWNKLEDVFQTRVARALHRLGVPTRDDIQHLFEQVDRLGQNVRELTRTVEAEAKARKGRAVKAAEPVAIGKIADPVA
ncbi:MAG TPA: phasin family protein [Xanthomonadaceae bacterium]|nr:phasin family protein [Xanthomonadaceae bacterium]